MKRYLVARRGVGRLATVGAAFVLAWSGLLGCEEPKKQEPAAPSAASTATALPTVAKAADAAAEAAAKKPKKKPEDCPKGPEVVFDNPDLESEVRFKLQKPKGKITRGMLATIKSINVSQKRTDELDICVFPLFKGLRSLYLGKGGLDDLSPIESLTKLENLRASINNVSDIEPLAGMTKMDRLDLGHTLVKDLTPLEGMKNLTDLQLDDTPVEDISSLAKLEKLEQLGIQRTRIKDLSPLKNLKNLKFLRMKGTNADTFVLMPLAKEGLKIIEQ